MKSITGNTPAVGAINRGVLDIERNFYGAHSWCLNAFPTIEQIVRLIRLDEKGSEEPKPSWCLNESAINVYLLACAISDTVDDYLLGSSYDLSKAGHMLPVIGPPMVKGVHACEGHWRRYRFYRLGKLYLWRSKWEEAVNQFLRAFLSGRETMVPCQGLIDLLHAGFPGELRRRRAKVPAAFRSQDLTHIDILTLGDKFI